MEQTIASCGGSHDDLFTYYLPFVREIARKIHRTLPPGVDVDSLAQAGVVGLLQAIPRFDPKRGVQFSTFARFRIEGEILEYLRSLDFATRSVRMWGRRIADAHIRLLSLYGREPSRQEVAEELGFTLPQYYHIEQRIHDATVESFEDLHESARLVWREKAVAWTDTLQQDPASYVEKKDAVEKLSAAVERLPERERLVVDLYYTKEMSLKAIGVVLGRTEGRICQIVKDVHKKLRNELEL